MAEFEALSHREDRPIAGAGPLAAAAARAAVATSTRVRIGCRAPLPVRVSPAMLRVLALGLDRLCSAGIEVSCGQFPMCLPSDGNNKRRGTFVEGFRASCPGERFLEAYMPAVQVDDILTLERIRRPDATEHEREVRSVTTAPSALEGEGFPVRRAFAGVAASVLDPFVHMDQMGEVEYAPRAEGDPWHPHRGFETVTYMIDGTFRHRDSTGGGGLITDGDTQWMTAGAGILHTEAPPGGARGVGRLSSTACSCG